MRRYNVLKWAVYALCILLLSVFQLQAAFYPRIMDVTPLFLVPSVVAIAMFEGETAGGVFGIAAGLVWDCGTGQVFGFNAFFLMCIGIAMGLLVKFLVSNKAVSAFLFTAVFTLTHELVTWFFFYYMKGSRDISFALLNVILPTVLLTLIFALPLYFGARRINQKLTSQDNEMTVDKINKF
jgi:rod shape-determining protein MreD